MRYCTSCLYPESKPDLLFNDRGVCSACAAYAKRATVNWEARRREFETITDSYRSADGTSYDCIVPVSGGKDSTYQVIRLLQQNMNPLCVTATTDSLSDIGRRNIENIKKLGVDYVEVSVNPHVRRKLNRLALVEVGDISWPEHVAIFSIPVRVAAQMGVRLIIWGENPQNEYGGPAANQQSKVLDRRWLEEFGGLLGLRVADLAAEAGIDRKHLIQYQYPSDGELERVGVTGLFLGHFFPWDGYQNVLISQAFGFETFPTAVEGAAVNYENLDNYQTGIHDYFKFLKFGFGRATDIVNNHIRRGRLTREDGLAIVRRNDGTFPATYLGRPLAEILAEIGMNVDEFTAICDRFTNKKIFEIDPSGKLRKDPTGRPIPKFQPH